MCVRVCTCMHVWMLVCFERYICVCGCMSVEETRLGKGGRRGGGGGGGCESETKKNITYLF